MKKYASYIILIFLIFIFSNFIPTYLPLHLQNALAQQAQEEELFLVAQKAFEDGFYDIAMRYIKQFLKKYPESEKYVQARILLGQCHFFKSQYLKAFDIFQGLLDFQELQDATLFWLGETYFKGSDYSEAKKHYEKLITLYPSSEYIPQAYYSLGWTYFEENNYKDSINIFTKLIMSFPEHQLSEDAIFKLGECEHNLGDYEKASVYFKKYILQYPHSTRMGKAFFYIAEEHYYLENFLEAVTYYAKAADITYDNKLIYLSNVSMGWSYLKLGKYDLSLKSFETAETLAKEEEILSDDIYLGKASLYSEMGENEKALKAYSTLIEKFPHSPRIAEAYLGKANLSYTARDYDAAAKEYIALIEEYSEKEDKAQILEKAYYGLAWTYLKAGQTEKSIETFQNIINKTDRDIVKVSALTQIGDAYHEIGQLNKAIGIYDDILRNYPDSLYTDYAQFRQGMALIKLNQFDAATLSLKSLQANFPTSKYVNDANYYLAVAQFKKEDWQNAAHYAENYLNNASEPDIYIVEAHYLQALSYFNLTEYQKALKKFQYITKTYPDQKIIFNSSLLNIAKCHYHSGNEKEALKRLISITQKFPGTEIAKESFLWLGNHFFEKTQFKTAVEYYKQFIDLFPDSDKIDVVQYEIGQAYQAMNQFDKAIAHYKLVGNSFSKELHTKAKLAIADIFSKVNSDQEAIKTYENIAVDSPEFIRDAYFNIAQIHKSKQNLRKAIDFYEKALTSKKNSSKINDEELQFYIADLYEVLNKTNKAVELYLKIPYLSKEDSIWSVKAYLRVARIFENADKWEQAITTYKKVVDYNIDESKYAEERINWINKNILQTK